MTRYGMLMDVTKCNGCYNCFLACKDEHCGTAHPGYSARPAHDRPGLDAHREHRARPLPQGQGGLHRHPLHALRQTRPASTAAARAGVTDAIYKRKDGIVLIDPKKAKGKKELVASCPYRVIYWNEEEQVPQKCTLCAHLLDDGWKEPRCVEACPTGALLFGDLDDPKSELSKALAAAGDSTEALGADPSMLAALGGFEVDAQSLQAHADMKEGVRYVGLPKTFVAGCVVLKDTDECAVGVTVTLRDAGRTSGDRHRRLRRLRVRGPAAEQLYTVTIAAPGYKPWSAEVETGAKRLPGGRRAGALVPPLHRPTDPRDRAATSRLERRIEHPDGLPQQAAILDGRVDLVGSPRTPQPRDGRWPGTPGRR